MVLFPRLPGGYALDNSDPDVFVLHREDGSFVAAFSARGVTMEAVEEAACEDAVARGLLRVCPATRDHIGDRHHARSIKRC